MYSHRKILKLNDFTQYSSFIVTFYTEIRFLFTLFVTATRTVHAVFKE